MMTEVKPWRMVWSVVLLACVGILVGFLTLPFAYHIWDVTMAFWAAQ